MEIISMNLNGETLKTEEINKLILNNKTCTDILSQVLDSVSENDE